jgi:hypothetical protein
MGVRVRVRVRARDSGFEASVRRDDGRSEGWDFE